MATDRIILLISAVFPPEQVTSAYLNFDLAKRLSKEYKVVVLRPKPTRPIGVDFGKEVGENIDFETIQINSYTHPESELIGRFKEAIDFSQKCCKYIKAHHREISFVYNDGWQLFGLYLIAKACVKYDLPYIVPIQDIYPESLFTGKSFPTIIRKIAYPILKYFDRYYQNHAVKVRTISSEMADYLSKTRRIDRDRYLTINNWQNDEDFKEPPTTPNSDELVFAYVGSVNTHANVDLIIKSFIKADLPNAELRIYGGGNQKENCIKLVSDTGAQNIKFGFVSRNEIPKIQAEASVLVLALPKGNGTLCLPSKLTSYLLSGKPVIASVDLKSSTSNIVNNEKCGIVVPPDDIDALCDAFKDFSEKPLSAIKEISHNSRTYALGNLTREVNLNKLIYEIKSIISND